MRKRIKQKLPAWLTFKQIREIVAYYDAQTPEEAIIEAGRGLQAKVGVPIDKHNDVRRHVVKRIITRSA